jgi:hypothetical protein
MGEDLKDERGNTHIEFKDTFTKMLIILYLR